MRRFSRWPRAEPGRFTTLFVFLIALVVVGLLLPQPFNLLLLTVAVVGLLVLTVASYTRNGSS
ncbi:hypothetical protein BH24ACT19_BH24ACT19_18310 [soil metagenome]